MCVARILPLALTVFLGIGALSAAAPAHAQGFFGDGSPLSSLSTSFGIDNLVTVFENYIFGYKSSTDIQGTDCTQFETLGGPSITGITTITSTEIKGSPPGARTFAPNGRVLYHSFKSALPLGLFGIGQQQSTPCSPTPQQNAPAELEQNNPPATPALNSLGVCAVGTPHTVTFMSTDPDGHNVRYGVDWDGDGSVNELVPPSGYVPSGTSQTASRTYSLTGDKTVKVMAQDEGGLTSDWATLTFSCAEPQPPAGQCTDNADNDGDGLIDSLDPDCTATAGLSEFPQGQQPPPAPPPPAGAILDLRVIPSLVRSGNTSKVNWSAQNVESCTVRGDNGDAWTGVSSPLGGQTSKPITGTTVYTLSCIDLNGATQTKTARVITIFAEHEE